MGSTACAAAGKLSPHSDCRLVVSKLVSSMDQTARVPSQPTCQIFSLTPLFFEAASGGFAEPMVRKNVQPQNFVGGDASHCFAN